ncbi:hypothetical protein [Polaribacter ponticola]|jgi:hypothetical protein|uniref:Lipoprotein n=1 Tax=Polaribacter ponticola TaxID=2978475 RepID=A0ABT5S4Z5_9FLAO|nr:hypothetical protein [Polaribacter sp. MSW5]MDD7913179.1 hypothetical protein [Polaribacter sp. MSW5]
MRKKLTISLNLLIVLFLTITLFSCSSDDDNILGQNDYSNKIDFDGQTYQISGGNFEEGGNNEYSMALFPKGITFNDSNNVINGGDWYLEIELITDDNTIEGTYKCGENVFGYFINNAQFVDDELQPGDIVYEVNQNGTLKINKLGNDYEFIYNAFDNRGVAFTVNYKGALTSL